MTVSLIDQLSERASDPEALRSWVCELIDGGDPQLAELVDIAVARGDVELCLLLVDECIAECATGTVASRCRALPANPSLRAALADRLAAMLDEEGHEQRRRAVLFAGRLRIDALAPRMVDALDVRARFDHELRPACAREARETCLRAWDEAERDGAEVTDADRVTITLARTSLVIEPSPDIERV